MRQFCTVMAVLIGGGVGLGAISPDAIAGPSPALLAPTAAPPVLIEKAGYWKRRWRRGYDPDVVVVPPADVEVDTDGDVDADVALPGERPPIIAIVPVRPASCGEYRYWDGDRCVDARYHNPYVGPR
jgi:hypothetical protein